MSFKTENEAFTAKAGAQDDPVTITTTFNHGLNSDEPRPEGSGVSYSLNLVVNWRAWTASGGRPARPGDGLRWSSRLVAMPSENRLSAAPAASELPESDLEENVSVIEKGLYIQYGCGGSAPSGWLNFDVSLRLRLERIAGVRQVLGLTVGLLFPPNVRFGDIVRGLPVPEKAACGVYCSHVLGCLAHEEMGPALRNTLRILRPGGFFRLVVPDLHWRVLQYIAASESGNYLAADEFMHNIRLGRYARPKDLKSFAREYGGRTANLWMYDFATLKAKLEDVGFVGIRRCELGDARDRMFDLVEEPGRFFDHGERELAIEASR